MPHELNVALRTRLLTAARANDTEVTLELAEVVADQQPNVYTPFPNRAMLPM